MPPIEEEKRRAFLVEDRGSDSESDNSSIWGDVEARFGRIQWAATTKAYSNLVLRRIAVFLLPSFIHHRFSPARERRSDNTSNGAKTLSPTAYLDGMRGLAAFFFSKYTSLWRLPFVRLLYSGPSMVCVFFVISGYALSLRPLQLARKRNSEAFARTTSSLVFRRFFRLYLPPVISTLGVALLLRWGAYEGTREFIKDRTFTKNVIEHHPVRLDSLSAQLTHWGHEMWAFLHIWSWANHAGSTQYDVHLWTIPLEFRCSMVLFLILIGTARLRDNVRLVVVGLLSWFVLRNDRWEMLLFLAGMTIADLDLRRNAHNGHEGRGNTAGSSSPQPTLQLPLDEKTKPILPASQERSTSDSFWTLVSIFALYLLSCPDAGPWDVPGWRYLGTLIPTWFTEKYRFWQVVGACLFYLGHLSYAVYLMHGPVTHVLGYPVQRWAWGITGVEGSGFKSGVVLAAIINIPLVVWAADIFWRAVDIPSVRFAKWLESKLSV
ncbi:hypothetical protein GQX73_g201 [Xylaria multiplex]|uniref:Acyltransferase 3 domain-containing protein n=1 Tax=Xylaria multiplex TaxID=323545 RepID=A0A7C8IVP3_9PEZI|nr:hypothetical protein GQX73_g201 [Xylaria multiplex]